MVCSVVCVCKKIMKNGGRIVAAILGKKMYVLLFFVNFFKKIKLGVKVNEKKRKYINFHNLTRSKRVHYTFFAMSAFCV